MADSLEKPYFYRANEWICAQTFSNARDDEHLNVLNIIHLDTCDEEHLKMIAELQSKLDSANEALIAERKKASSIQCCCFVCVWSWLDKEVKNQRDCYLGYFLQAEIVAAENAKLQYRIIHLVRTAREAHQKLEQIWQFLPFERENWMEGIFFF